MSASTLLRREPWQRGAERKATAARRSCPTSEQDPYYDAELLTWALNAGGDARLEAMRRIQGSVLEMSLDEAQCRVVQLALDVGREDDRARIAEGLRGHVRQALSSKHGNFVLEKVIQKMPSARTNFVIEELPDGAVVAKDCKGCRILRRLIEQSGTSASLAKLLENSVLRHVDELARDQFGRHVIQAVLEFGKPEHRARIAEALRDHVLDLARDRNGSHVIEAALQFCSSEDQRPLVDRILADGIFSLAQDPFGAFVVCAILGLRPQGPEEARRQAMEGAVLLQQTKEGSRVLRHAEVTPSAAGAADRR